ncbi:MAG: carbohydrate ABC transporter permease [Thermoflexales bacterium]|nr:carbohydrate ABC transporter permease [Thermoflexales bacterium]
MSLKTQRFIGKAFGYLGLLLLIVFIGLPVFWLVIGAFKANKEILTANPQFLPASFQFDNFTKAWTGAKFSSYYINSIATTLMGATAEIVMAVTTAYALVFIRFPFRNAVFILLLIALMVPEQVVIVPNFLTIANMGLLITKGGTLETADFIKGWLAIFLPGASIAFGTFLLRQYFRTIPMDLTDASKVDGASHFQTMLNVVVPVATPAIATSGLLSFTAKWNEYLWPLIVTYSDQLRTLPIAISRLLDAEGNTEWGVVMAGALFVVVPVIVVFLLVQRFVVEGLAAGAVKG